jgi:methylglyoxal synthase
MEIALIAHDGKKLKWFSSLNEHREILNKKRSSSFYRYNWEKVKKAGFEVNALLSGPLGGDAQIAASVAEGQCHMVLFFRDPLDRHPHEPDILMLMRLCDVHNVPLEQIRLLQNC